MMRKGLALIFLLVGLPVVVFGQALVNVQDATTVAGGDTTIDVTASAVPAPGLSDIQGTITFDPAVMQITALQGLDGFAGFFFAAIDNNAGTATFTAAIVGGGTVTAGEIFRMFVEAIGIPGQSCFVNVAFTVFRAGDGTDLAVTVDPGVFTIGSTAPPVSWFEFTPQSPTISDIVQFTDLSSDQDGVIVAWNWTFGDGGVSTNVDPSHQYANGGSYTVTLTVTDDDGATDAFSDTITVLGPSAAFNYTPASPTTQEVINFFDQSVDPTGDIASWSWEFGDGGDSGAQNPTYAYGATGTYRVDLTITTTGGGTVSTFRFITVRNSPPIAAYTFDPAQPNVGQMVTFGAGGSSDPDGNIVIFEWDFDNDGVTDATGSTVTHAFDIVGARPVTLKVTDDSGAFDFVTHVVPVQASPPVAAFTFTPAAPNTGETVAFDASSSADPDGTIILYEWDFDNDGTTDATGMAVTHSWPNPGVYPVTLLVTDNDGAFGAETQGVPVQIGGTGGANQLPVADFEFTPAVEPEANINEVISFGAAGSSDADGEIAAYEWDFDNDGVYDATGANASRVFVTGGAKIVTLRVTDNDGGVGFKTKVVAVQFVRPTAVIAYLPVAPEVGDVISFDGSGSFDDDGRVDFFEWDFDDDGIPDATGMTVNYVFNTGGGKPVTLTVTDNDGVVDVSTVTVPITINGAPIAGFTYAPLNPTTVDDVVFTHSSVDGDGTIVAVLWNFGDGTTLSTQTPSHRFATAGTFAVTLTVTDDDGATGQTTTSVVVSADTNVAPVANFDFTPGLPRVGDVVQFTDNSTDTGGSIASWAWVFGDGKVSEGTNPTNTYQTAGSFEVSLTVTDNLGVTNTKTKTVTIGAVGGADIPLYAFPNPAATIARFMLSLPSDSSDATLRIFDLTGRKVLSVTLATTATEYAWSLLDEAGDRVSNGLYICVVTAISGTGRSIKSEIFRLLVAQ